VLARGARGELKGSLGRIAAWSWGEGRTILLIHGWGGHAGRLTHYVEPLTHAGFRVLAFDAPGHGDSSGWRVSLPELAIAIAQVAEQVGPIHGVVAHSLGATAVAIALRNGLHVDRAVFLAPASDPEKLSSRFGRLLRLSKAECELMKGRLLQRYNLRWSELKIVDWARSLSTSLLVFHDRGDFKVPLAEGQAIVRAWPRGQLVMTRGLGHHKILRDPAVIIRAVAFLAKSDGSRKNGSSQACRGKQGPPSGRLRPAPVRLGAPVWAESSRYSRAATMRRLEGNCHEERT